MKKIASGSALLLLATVLGVATAAAAFAWLSSAETEQTAAATALERTRPAVVALADIPAGTTITSDLVEVRDVPQGTFLSGTPGDVPAVLGRVARYPILAGEQVNPARLVIDGQATGTGLAFSVPPGMRAVAVSVNEQRASGGLIVPGDRVDVMVHTDYERLFAPADVAAVVTNEEKRHPTTLTVLQDVLVLAVAQVTTPPFDGQSDAQSLRPESGEAQPGATSVTLAVTPAQAQSLFFAAQEGTVGLMVRPFGDESTITIDPLLRLEPLGAVGTGFVRH